jgi:hypothetical protein
MTFQRFSWNNEKNFSEIFARRASILIENQNTIIIVRRTLTIFGICVSPPVKEKISLFFIDFYPLTGNRNITIGFRIANVISEQSFFIKS